MFEHGKHYEDLTANTPDSTHSIPISQALSSTNGKTIRWIHRSHIKTLQFWGEPQLTQNKGMKFWIPRYPHIPTVFAALILQNTINMSWQIPSHALFLNSSVLKRIGPCFDCYVVGPFRHFKLQSHVLRSVIIQFYISPVPRNLVESR